MFNNLKMQIHLIIQYFKNTTRNTFGVIAICINLQSIFANYFFDHKATCTIYTEVSFLTYCRVVLRSIKQVNNSQATPEWTDSVKL